MQKRTFSLPMYVCIVLLFSWPFQIAYIFLGEQSRPILLLSMIMAGLATYICGRFVFRDGFAQRGTSWGRPVHYLFAFGLSLFIWLAPIVIGVLTGSQTLPALSIRAILTTFVASFAITFLPALGEEFSWRSYLLPRLLAKHSTRRALLIHGFITWFWHLPVLIAMGLAMPGNRIINVAAVGVISLLPTIMHAIVFAFIWSTSNSLVVSTVYHTAFDEVRDTLEDQVGFGPLVQIWQMATLTILGLTFIWKTKWLRRFD